MNTANVSPISRVYAQYHTSLREAKADYEARLRSWGERLLDEWERCIRDNVYSFLGLFQDRDFRATQLRTWVERFFGTSEVPFVAIDGSSYVDRGDRFISIYGGAYGSRGTVTITEGGGKLVYRRWEMSRDVSMVAFIPIPPEAGGDIVESAPEAGQHEAQALSDRDVAEFTSMHNRVMQLAEVYLAHSLISPGSQESPRLVLMDTTLSGWLGNTSFGPRFLRIEGAKVCGERIERHDIYTVLAHPLSRELGVPPAIRFLPHLRLIAECHWRETDTLRESDLPEDVRGEVFRLGARALSKLELADVDKSRGVLTLNFDPESSWRKMVRTFEEFCRNLFRKKSSRGLICTASDGSQMYLSPRDVQFLSGVGLRSLIERCWSPEWRVLLVGVVKDSHSKYFMRNYLGSVHVLRGEEPGLHTRVQLSDRTALELLAQLVDDLVAPWATLEFDSAFMTLIPRETNGSWSVRGYERREAGGEYTRPPRLFLKSLAQFLLKPRSRLASHVIFIDRLAYPGWDDSDSEDATVGSGEKGAMGLLRVLRFTRPSRLHIITMFLLTVLVRNHFPNAIGYPEPLYKADWGATSMRDQIKELLKSSWIIESSDPLQKTFRRVRDSLRR